MIVLKEVNRINKLTSDDDLNFLYIEVDFSIYFLDRRHIPEPRVRHILVPKEYFENNYKGNFSELEKTLKAFIYEYGRPKKLEVERKMTVNEQEQELRKKMKKVKNTLECFKKNTCVFKPLKI